MPTDESGNYTLPQDKVEVGQVIDETWANPTFEDIAQGLTDKLDRDGNGGMLAPLKYAGGSRIAPGVAFDDEKTSGIYRADQYDIRITVQGEDVLRAVERTVTPDAPVSIGIVGGDNFGTLLIGAGAQKEQPTFNGLSAASIECASFSGNRRLEVGGNNINNTAQIACGSVSSAGTLLGGENVSSVTKLGTGEYRISLAWPMGTSGAFLIHSGAQEGYVRQVGSSSQQKDVVFNVDTAFSFIAMLDYGY